MQRTLKIGLIGDFDASVPAHQAIPLALQRAAEAEGAGLQAEWLATDSLPGATQATAPPGQPSATPLAAFDGLWCVPASPYRSLAGALFAIRHARESGTPFLGTCGGFQHAVLEFARHVLGWADAEHAETAPGCGRAVISPLACALVETVGDLRLLPGTRIAAAYAGAAAREGYRCRYGLNPEFRAALLAGPLRACADDDTGEVRAVELDGHPFFVATLFQPERAALQGHDAPLVSAFVRACLNESLR